MTVKPIIHNPMLCDCQAHAISIPHPRLFEDYFFCPPLRLRVRPFKNPLAKHAEFRCKRLRFKSVLTAHSALTARTFLFLPSFAPACASHADRPAGSPRLRVKPLFFVASCLRARDLFFSSAFGINSMSYVPMRSFHLPRAFELNYSISSNS